MSRDRRPVKKAPTNRQGRPLPTPPATPAAAAGDGLNAAQDRFCEEYLLDLNATAAYQRAYPEASPKSARTAGPRLLANVRIASRMAELQAARSARTQIHADQILEEIALLARSNVQHYQIDELGNVVLIPGVAASAMRAVSSIKRKITHVTLGERTQVTYDTELRLWSKPDALRMAGQHLALFTEKREITGKDGEPLIPIEAIRQALRDAGA